ncbi:MAG: hypothetical protein II007_01620 [Gammaproteobacteria bacterium]|nr:hypothetical protein [Gammaproteobacteria bacterium]
MISKKDFIKHFFASELWGWMQDGGFVQGKGCWLAYRSRGDLLDVLELHLVEHKEGREIFRLDVSYALAVESKQYLALARNVDIDESLHDIGKREVGYLKCGLSDSFIEEFEEGSWSVNGFIHDYGDFFLRNDSELEIFWRLFPRSIKEHLLPWIEKVQTPEQLHALLPPLWADDPVVRLALLGEEPPAPTGVASRCRVMGRFGAITAVKG